MIESEGIVVALCHLRQGSIDVRPGWRVQVGDRLALCGNSGNSTEPHLHVQTLDGRDIQPSIPVPMTFNGPLPANGEVIHSH